jgi:hypothetical protein
LSTGGFEVDPFVAEPWPRTWGLNLALGWPLPVDVAAYQELAGGLAALDPGLFVYPHAQTHVTVVTLVSFKEHVEPSAEEVRELERLIAVASAAVAPVAATLGPIELELGAPVLAPRAVFLPIQDPAGAVARLRAAVMPALRAGSPRFAQCHPPAVVHSTLARFRAAPRPDFAARFERWATDRVLGPARVGSILLTTETRPYMRDGQAVGVFPLASGPR